MRDYRKSVNLTLVLVYISIGALAVFTVTLPFLAGWFVEIRGKDPRLATTIMITCYPCVPFAAIVLHCVRKLLKNIQSGLVLGDANIKYIKITAFSLALAGLIMIAGGFRYMPFFIAGIAVLACALLVAVIKNVFDAALSLQREQEFESVREFYENESGK